METRKLGSFFVKLGRKPEGCASRAVTLVAMPDNDAPVDAYEASKESNDCPECARSFGPHFTGKCEHTDGAA